MKNLIFYLILGIANLLILPGYAQNNNEPVALGLPGDNFNLYAVLDVFQKSPTLESFERAVNDKDNKINNLDLNNDKVIDYVEVKTQKTGNTNLIILQTAVNSKEYQDIAVIDVHKNNAGKVVVQIIGDENLYGKNYIIEPAAAGTISETPNPGYTGNDTQTNITINNYSNGIYYANDWPIVGYLYSPGFSIYISPWHWGLYPSWWYPWAPFAYYDYWGFHNHYYYQPYYRRCAYVRYPNYYHYYAPRRSISPTVTRYRNTGRYAATYGGRTYSQPIAPKAEPSRATARPSAPSISGARTAPATARPASATARPAPPTARPAPATAKPAPAARPLPSNPPVNTRVAKPSVDKTVSPILSRPSSETSRPASPVTRPSAPVARPAPAPMPSARPMSPPRPIMPGGHMGSSGGSRPSMGGAASRPSMPSSPRQGGGGRR